MCVLMYLRCKRAEYVGQPRETHECVSRILVGVRYSAVGVLNYFEVCEGEGGGGDIYLNDNSINGVPSVVSRYLYLL